MPLTARTHTSAEGSAQATPGEASLSGMFLLTPLRDRLYSRCLEDRMADTFVGAVIPNLFTHLTMGDSTRIGQVAPAA
jgi:hypothetical protein